MLPRVVRLRGAAIGVLALAVAGFALRASATTWGKPYVYHFDEPFIIKPAVRIVASGDPNPHFFRYPSALIYMEAAIVAVQHKLTGLPLDLPEGPAHGPADLLPETWPAVAAGRLLVSVFGAAAIVGCALLAGAAGGTRAALAAAAILAVFPLHVEHSHYLTTDVPAATLLVWACVPLARRRWSVASAVRAGALVGFATATKYTAAVGAAVLVFYPLLAGGIRWRPLGTFLATSAAAAVAAFLLACPYAIVDSGAFLSDLAIVGDHYRSGHVGAEGTANWLWYVDRLAQDGLGSAGLVALGIGAVVGIAEGFRLSLSRRAQSQHAPALIFVAGMLAVAWFAWLGSIPVRFERNLMPAVVLLSAVAGFGWARLAALVPKRAVQLVVTATFACTLLVPASMAVRQTMRFRGDDTRSLAARWVEANIAGGAAIVREEYTPQIDPRRYRVEYVWSLAFQPLARYRSSADYVVASSGVYGRFLREPAVSQYPDIAKRYRRILSWPKVAQFVPGPGTTGPRVNIHRVPREHRGAHE